MIKFQRLTGSALCVNLIKLKTNLTFLNMAISTLKNTFYEKIEHIIPTFKQLSFGTSHYTNIQLAKYISSCFDLRNILLSNLTNVV